MSAIDWLSNSVNTPAQVDALEPTESAPNAPTKPEAISVAALGTPSRESIGLLAPHVTGLPPDLWGDTRAEDLARRITAEHTDMLPAMQDLLLMILLAELDAPEGSNGHPTLLLARIDKLLALGAVEQAEALMERAGPSSPDLFRRWFDVALLTGREDRACAVMRATPDLSPTVPARIFCLARGGDWSAAALTLETGQAIGEVSTEEAVLLTRFLDAEIAEGAPALPIPQRPSPLTFRLYEAIGEPLPTTTLPLAFAHADLRGSVGWKAQVEAAERLARTGAIDANKLLGLYTERKPAASGGVWDRVAAVQAFDVALRAGNIPEIERTLPKAWDAVEAHELEVAFADLFAEPLLRLPLNDRSRGLAVQIGLLSDGYEAVARNAAPQTPKEEFLVALAQGDVSSVSPPTPFYRAVQDGFSREEAPVRLQSLVAGKRLGEAVLRAMELFTEGSRGDLDEISDALALFRAVGLEDTARRAALQLLILDRRG